MIIKALRFVAQVTVLWVIFWFGNQIERLFHLPIPGNVIGMVLLFLLLLGGIVKLEHIQEAADFLLKHLVFFFIPFAVGLMNWGGFFYQNGLVLAATIVLSMLIPFGVIGFVAKWLHGGKK